jgi:hypothetical protein
VGVGGVVGISFVAFAVFGIFPSGTVSLLVCGAILSLAAGAILLPRLLRESKPPLPPPDGGPSPGAVPAGDPRKAAAPNAEGATGGAV